MLEPHLAALSHGMVVWPPEPKEDSKLLASGIGIVISPMDSKLQRPSVLAPLQQEWWLDSLAFPYLYTSELQHLCFSLWVLLSLHTLGTWEIHYFLIHIPDQEVSFSGPADVNASRLFFFPPQTWALHISPAS